MARLVDYTLPDGRTVPALVTTENDDGTVNLRVFAPTQTEQDTFINSITLDPQT